MKQQAQKMEGSPSCKRGKVPRKLTRRSLERMWLPRRFWEANFERISEGGHKAVLESYLRGIERALSKGFGMILWGNNGVGKTAAAALCLKQARRWGATGLFLTANQYVGAVMSRRAFDDAQTVEQRARSVDLLVFDDVGKEAMHKDLLHDGVVAILEDLLRSRSSNMKSTILTMNIDMGRMEERYGKSFSRLMQESAVMVEMVGPSQRERGKEELAEFFKG